MGDNNIFVELFAKLNLPSFASAVKQALNMTDKLEKIDINFDTSKLLKAEEKVNDLQEALNIAKESNFKGFSSSELMGLATQLKEAKQEYDGLLQEQQEAIEKAKEINDQEKKHAENIKKSKTETSGWNNSFKQISSAVKKVVFGLLGVRTVYSSIRKAMSTYLSQNDDLQSKLNVCWYALGSLFAPILEKIVNLFAKIVTYVDIFVKALGFAGINMSNFNKKAGSSAKSINKMVAGFDEINNINQQDNSGGVGGGNPLANADIDTKWADKIREFGEWFKENWVYVVAGIAGITTAIGLLKLVLETGGIFGEDGVLNTTRLMNFIGVAVGIGIAIAGIVLTIKALIDYIKDPSWANFGEVLKSIGLAIAGVGIVIGTLTGNWIVALAGAIIIVAGYLAQHFEEIMAFFDNILSGVDNALELVHKNLTTKFGIFGALIGTLIEIALEIFKTGIGVIRDLFEGLFKGVKQILDGIIKIFKGDFKGGINDILKGILKIISGVLNSVIRVVEGALNVVIRGINGLFGGLISAGASLINKLFGTDLPGKIPTVTLPRIALATGTNYVPNDMIAQIHKGEAVIPKKFNSQEYFNMAGNEETNALLRQLIDVIDTKEFKAYISQKEVGKSAVDYINKQSRVMGGALV